MKRINIAIDGYSGCGKSSTAKIIAKALDYTYIDTGAMYRAVTLYFLDNHVSLTNPNEIETALNNIKIRFVKNESSGQREITLNGVIVENEIRTMRINENVSQVSAIGEVRKALVEQQQHMAKKKGVVMDGRDIGTDVLPDAELKIFMVADIDVRAERRQKELMEKDIISNFDEVKNNLINRDKIDTTREVSPLRKAEDAILVDNTQITLDEQVDQIIGLAVSKITEN